MKPRRHPEKFRPTRNYHRSALQSSIMLHADLDRLASDQRAIESMARTRGMSVATVREIIESELARRAAL